MVRCIRMLPILNLCIVYARHHGYIEDLFRNDILNIVEKLIRYADNPDMPPGDNHKWTVIDHMLKYEPVEIIRTVDVDIIHTLLTEIELNIYLQTSIDIFDMKVLASFPTYLIVKEVINENTVEYR